VLSLVEAAPAPSGQGEEATSSSQAGLCSGGDLVPACPTSGPHWFGGDSLSSLFCALPCPPWALLTLLGLAGAGLLPLLLLTLEVGVPGCSELLTPPHLGNQILK
jgi:hypothetical protein